MPVDDNTYFRIRRTERRQTIEEIATLVENRARRLQVTAIDAKRTAAEIRALLDD